MGNKAGRYRERKERQWFSMIGMTGSGYQIRFNRMKMWLIFRILEVFVILDES
jgi:hypothetical protein